MPSDKYVPQKGDNVRQARRERGLTQDSLAQLAGVSKNTISNLENGHAVTLTTTSYVSEALGKEPSDLFSMNAVDATRNDLGFRCYASLELAWQLTNIITKLRKRKGYDRVRLYVLSRSNSSFAGVVELGGVDDNFRRTRLLLFSDPLSQVLLAHPGAVRYSRDLDDGVITPSDVYHGEERIAIIDDDLYPYLLPHDQDALCRDSLSAWMDVALLSEKGDIMGKLSIDCLRDQCRNEDVLRPDDRDLWDIANEAGEEISRYRRGEKPTDVPSGDVLEQAFRYMALQDHLRTMLVKIKRDASFSGGFDRFRLYLMTETHAELFGKYSKARDWSSVPEAPGLVGFVELGGVAEVFTEISLTSAKDFCTEVLLISSADHEEYHRRLRSGEPVIFTVKHGGTDGGNESESVPRCHVPLFYTPEALERGKHLTEHLDQPIVSRTGELFGKITIDSKWHEGCQLPRLSEQQVGDLKRHASMIGRAIEGMKTTTDGRLYDSLNAQVSSEENLLL